jgi:glycosyltransferase involved in cell wall biosynthesis
MKILYLTFYFEPDLCAGSFRNTSLVKSLSRALKDSDSIDVITTYPNRYESHKVEAPTFEERGNVQINRISVPKHKSGFLDQMNTFRSFFIGARNMVKKRDYDLVFASSSRLFTAYLGYTIAHKKNIPLYLDIRDIFLDTIEDILKKPLVKAVVLPLIKLIERRTFNAAAHINLVSGGFLSYFRKFKCIAYSEFSNGIDDEFLNLSFHEHNNEGKNATILYAGNIGEGQGMEKIIPSVASMLGNDYNFVIVGDGGTKTKLQSELTKRGLTNVELKDPVNRDELKILYNNADYLFLHLNDYKAFEKVLPSKIFEYAAYDIPIIAGVSGFAYEFIRKNISNAILFKPCDAEDLANQMRNFKYITEHRSEFIQKFKRETTNNLMVESMLKIIPYRD